MSKLGHLQLEMSALCNIRLHGKDEVIVGRSHRTDESCMGLQNLKNYHVEKSCAACARSGAKSHDLHFYCRTGLCFGPQTVDKAFPSLIAAKEKERQPDLPVPVPTFVR